MDSNRLKGIDKTTLFMEIDLRELSTLIKSKRFKKTDVIFVCHPDAQQALEVWCDLLINQNNEWVDIRFARFLNQQIPLYLIDFGFDKSTKPEQPIFQFFNAFDLVRSILRSDDQDKFTIKLLDKPNSTSLEFLSWVEVVRLLHLKVLDPDVGIPLFRTLINQKMPEHLRKQFFGSSKLEVDYICQVAGLNRRQYDYQQSKRKNLNDGPTEISKTLFEHIVKEARNVSE